MATIIGRFAASALVLCVVMAGAGHAQADADDQAWIRQCVKDNKDEGQTSETVLRYCSCMNDHMSSSETRSITEWEKTHKQTADECGEKAGWVGK